MLFNKKITAAEGQDCGLVTAVFPSASFEKNVSDLIDVMAELPTKVNLL